MKEKRRYILVKYSGGVAQEAAQEFEHGLYRELLKMLGELHYADANPKLAKMLEDGYFVQRSSLSGASDCILALSMIKKLNGEDAFFYTIKSSGTLKALLKHYKAERGAQPQEKPKTTPAQDY